MILIENEYTLQRVKFLKVNYLGERFFGEKKDDFFLKKNHLLTSFRINIAFSISAGVREAKPILKEL
jgi:hypothetical protein